LKLCASELAPAIVRVFQTSLGSGTVPSDWKKALITPLFKKGEWNVASNYRPVSLTSVVSKILIVHSSIMRHLDHQKHSDRLSTQLFLSKILRITANINHPRNCGETEIRKRSN
jgi:hypothetical protein